jgi:hypothetical protein
METVPKLLLEQAEKKLAEAQAENINFGACFLVLVLVPRRFSLISFN